MLGARRVASLGDLGAWTDEEPMLGVSATAGVWSALVIAGTALAFFGVILALSATLPAYEGRKEARTEGGVFFSFVGAVLVLVGTTEELRPHVGRLLLVFDGVILILVTCGVARVLFRIVAHFFRTPSHRKIGAHESPKKYGKQP
jgi:hypothetical protein